jgi:hypothetical protein
VTICAGVPTDNLEVGGPKFGRRRLKPNPLNTKRNYYNVKQFITFKNLPVNESSSPCKEVDRLLLDAAGILFASLTGVDMASSA